MIAIERGSRFGKLFFDVFGQSGFPNCVVTQVIGVPGFSTGWAFDIHWFAPFGGGRLTTDIFLGDCRR
jgi:hypothetical protein